MTSTAGPAFRIQQAGPQQQFSMEQEWFSTCEWKNDFNCLVCHDSRFLWNFRRSSACVEMSACPEPQQSSAAANGFLSPPALLGSRWQMASWMKVNPKATMLLWISDATQVITMQDLWGPPEHCVCAAVAPRGTSQAGVGSHTGGHLHVTWVNSGRTMAPATDYMLQEGGMLATCWCTSAELILNNYDLFHLLLRDYLARVLGGVKCVCVFGCEVFPFPWCLCFCLIASKTAIDLWLYIQTEKTLELHSCLSGSLPVCFILLLMSGLCPSPLAAIDFLLLFFAKKLIENIHLKQWESKECVIRTEMKERRKNICSQYYKVGFLWLWSKFLNL